MEDFHKVASTEDIREGELKSFLVETEVVCVCNVNGKYYAFKDQCSHQEFPLSDGDLEGEVVTCAYHGAEFNVTSGEALCMPAVEPIETFEVKVENGEIFVSID